MSIVFSDTSTNLGIVQRVRKLMRVDATQWPTANIVNSCNDWLDTVINYGITADRKFPIDDTNHTLLPEGTANLVINQSDYSFLTDQSGNNIITLTRIDIKDSNGIWRQLELIDQSDIKHDGLQSFYTSTGFPLYYDKIADNIIRLYPTPDVSVTAGIKFYFQRTPSYFTAADTTKTPGVSPLLHRGFVIAAAYDGAMTLGLKNTAALSVEFQKETAKMENYWADRNRDDVPLVFGQTVTPFV